MIMITRSLFATLLTLPGYALAETPPPGYLPPPEIVSTEGMLQMVAGLLLVLAIIGAIAWALKRFALPHNSASENIKIIASVGVGQRERIVLVEIENTRLVLGVAPGRVNTLHCIDKSANTITAATLAQSQAQNFQEQLNQSG